MRDNFLSGRRILPYTIGVLAVILIAIILVVGAFSQTKTQTSNSAFADLPVPSTIPTVVTSPTLPAATPSIAEPTQTPYPLVERDFDTWFYRVALSNPPSAVVVYTTTSISALQSYAASSRALASQLAGQGGQIEVVVTFRSYVSPEQYRSWVAAKGLTPLLTSVRFVDANGLRGATGIAPKDGDVLPLGAQSTPASSAISGVMAVRGTIAAAQLMQLANDPLVFIPDCTTTKVRHDLTQDNVPGAEQTTVQLGSPFWDMEDFGLSNFQQ